LSSLSDVWIIRNWWSERESIKEEWFTRKTSVKETVERDLDVFLVTTKAGS